MRNWLYPRRFVFEAIFCIAKQQEGFMYLGTFKDLELRVQGVEAGEEIRRVVWEKGLSSIRKFVFWACAFLLARICTKDYIKARLVGGENIFCLCGYHLSRRKMGKILKKEIVYRDLRRISNEFASLDLNQELEVSADVILKMIDLLRKEICNPEILNAYEPKPEDDEEVFSGLARHIICRLLNHEIDVARADDELIELKGHYQMRFDELGIKKLKNVKIIIP